MFVQRRTASVLVSMLGLLFVFHVETVNSLDFCMRWDDVVLHDGPLKDAPTSLFEPHPIYACTKEADIPFCPNCATQRGKECVAGETCSTCRDICEAFDRGSYTSWPLSEVAGSCLTRDLVGLERFPPTCLPRVQTVEGIDSPLGTYLGYIDTIILADNSTVDECRGLEDRAITPYPTETITVEASVRWGYLNVYNLKSKCNLLDALDRPCVYTNVEGIDSVRFETHGAVLEEVRTLQLTGKYEAVMRGMLNMSFVPLPLYNTLRVRHNQISPTTTRVQPWFQVEYRTAVGGTIDRASEPFTQLIDVLAVNDPPRITDPQEGYIRGCLTSTPCGTEFSKYAREDVEGEREDFYFGQYWRREGSFEEVLIKGQPQPSSFASLLLVPAKSLALPFCSLSLSAFSVRLHSPASSSSAQDSRSRTQMWTS
eukprot:1969626-Rhodomonas_salina.1